MMAEMTYLLEGDINMAMTLALGSSACARRGTKSPSKYVADFSNVTWVPLFGFGGKKFKYLR